MNLKTLLFFTFFRIIFFVDIATAQTKTIDSLNLLLTDKKSDVETISKLALEYSKINKDSFAYYTNLCCQIADKNNNNCEKIFSFNTKAGLCMTLAKNDSAFFYYKKALSYTLTCEIKIQKALILTSWSFVSILKGKYDTVITLCTEAINELDKISDNKSTFKIKCKALKFIGESNLRLGKYDKASKALYYAKEINHGQDIAVEAMIDASLGNMYTSKQEKGKAIVYQQLAIDGYKKVNDYNMVHLTLGNLINAYLENKNYDSATIYLKDAEKYNVYINNPSRIGYINKCWARVFEQTKKYDSAIFYFDKAIINYTIAEADDLKADCFMGKARVYKALKNYLLSKENYLEAKTLFMENDMQNELSGAYYEIALVENEIGNYKSAYDNLLVSFNMEDSLLSQEVIDAEKEAEIKYETTLKEAKITSQELQLSSERKQKYWLFGGLSILALVLGGLIYFYRRIKKQKAQIQNQKLEILHNNRNNIQQLISIFSRQAENEEYKENALANQERLFTLNLLNKLLYENGESNQANIKDYLGQLCEAKQISAGNMVQLKVTTPSILLASNLLKDIGLIVNELTTNAIKYASADNATPIVSISVNTTENFINLLVKDNGKGLPADFNLNDERKSFGLEFVNDLVSQHHGKINTYNDNGTCFDIKLKMPDVENINC